jgi:hypothetical protein
MCIYINIFILECMWGLRKVPNDNDHDNNNDDHDDNDNNDGDDNDIDDVYLKKITTRVSQNLILHRNADHPKT